MKTSFWLLIFLIIYTYFFYPLLLCIFAKIFRREVKKSSREPSVSIIVSVCDEEDVIEKKIRNLLSLDYPHDKIEILIGSDGSTDQTNDIIRRCQDMRFKLIEKAERRGKMAMINELAGIAKSEIIVFTDARQAFASDALRQLVDNFADESVGCVSGELIFRDEKSVTGKGINLYWKYEKFLRNKEAQIHSMLGATGAIYAIRRSLFKPAPGNTVLDDMFIPIKIILQGYRAAFDPSAHAYDHAAENPEEEYRRKVRTLYGNYQIFSFIPEAFNPLKSPIALQLISHKLLRLLVPFFMIAVFIINALLMGHEPYLVIFKLQALFYATAISGALLRRYKYGTLTPVAKICFIPYIFCLLNFSAFMGFFRFLTASQEITWKKARKS